MTENQQARKKLQEELRKLFQFNVSDLDFGIYRILSRKKDRIEQFIEKDLLDAVNEGLKEYQQQDASQLDDIKQQIIENLSDDAFDDQGKLVKYENTKLGKEYLQALEKAEKQQVGADTEKKIYNDLFTFFSRYYSEGDFVTKRRISTRDSKYAVPYNGEEVLLHWANKDQYYIKTGEHFTNYKFEVDGKSVWFKVAQAEQDRDNVKEEEKRSFVLRPDNPIEINDDELTIWFEYRPLADEEESQWLKVYNSVEKSRKTIDRQALCIAYDEWIRRELDEKWRKPLSVDPNKKGRSILHQKLNHYTAKNTADYFIHKDLQSFLERELEYYLKSEVIRVDDFIEDQTEQTMDVALTRAKVVWSIGKKIIAFLSQIENFQKKLFEKKRFVVDTHYCFTLDKVPEDLYDTILENKDQLQSWEELYAMDKWSGELQWNGKWTKAFLKAHSFMIVDTQFFDEEFKFETLNSIDSIENVLNGYLLNGDNFHALNLLKKTFLEKIKTAFIDPPYNTEKDQSTGKFIYKDGLSHSSWLSMLNDRLAQCYDLLKTDGSVFTTLDDNEIEKYLSMSKSIFGDENHIATIIWEKVHTRKNSAQFFSVSHDYVTCFAKNRSKWDRNLIPRENTDAYKNPDNDSKGPWKLDPVYANNPYDVDYIIEKPNGIKLSKPEGQYWRFSEEKLKEKIKRNEIVWGEGDSYPMVKRYLAEVQDGLVPVTLFDRKFAGDNSKANSELDDLFDSGRPFSYPKPSKLVERLFQVNLGKISNDFVIDFFAGSGTTGHAVLNLNREDNGQRKYILVEMGQYFDTVLKPRIQKVVFSNNWKDGIPQDRDGQSHAFKYHFIESYEDALNNIDFKNPDDTQQAMEFEDYMLSYMLDFETQGVSASLLKDGAFDTPFDYKLNIQRGHESPSEETVDLVETFHYLIGLWVQKLRRLEHQNRKYIISSGQIRDEDAVEDVCIIWRNTKDLDLDEEAGWIQKEIIKDQTFDRMYINGVSKVKDAEPIEITFREKMFEGVA